MDAHRALFSSHLPFLVGESEIASSATNKRLTDGITKTFQFSSPETEFDILPFGNDPARIRLFVFMV